MTVCTPLSAVAGAEVNTDEVLFIDALDEIHAFLRLISPAKVEFFVALNILGGYLACFVFTRNLPGSRGS